MNRNTDMMDKIRKELENRAESALSPHATRNTEGKRRRTENMLESDYRQDFALDADRILHSRAYTRYIDKTQVFYLVENDHITHRVLHVQLVSKIARTIGRFLRLNEDLIEAMALGHDIGHAPFGHDGERFLSDLCHRAGIGYFHHNIQSVQFLDKVERGGAGWNLCLQTLDGILCHDGEVHDPLLKPIRQKTFEKLAAQMDRKKQAADARLTPMTLEGCVVRMADTISYIGRDIEDAIRLNVIRREDLPDRSTKILGNSNGTIVHRLVTDVILNSYGRSAVAFSPDVSEALRKLKAFNLERIYLNPIIKRHTSKIRILFDELYERFLVDIEKDHRESAIFTAFLDDKNDDYLQEHRPAEMVRDFIAGMTDQYFLRQFPKASRPKSIEC